MPRAPRHGRSGTGRVLMVAATATALVLGSAACAGSHDTRTISARGVVSAPAGPATPASVPTTATVRSVVGHLSQARRDHTRTAVGAVVDRWIDAAYLGSFPRSALGDAFSIFTPPAARLATRDADLMSDARLGDDVTGVSAVRRRLRLDLLAVAGRPVGVTVAFAIGLRVEGSTTRRQRVSGHLYLTHEKSGQSGPGTWQVFGYDAQRGEI